MTVTDRLFNNIQTGIRRSSTIIINIHAIPLLEKSQYFSKFKRMYIFRFITTLANLFHFHIYDSIQYIFSAYMNLASTLLPYICFSTIYIWRIYGFVLTLPSYI